jgi:hypothetical protein
MNYGRGRQPVDKSVDTTCSVALLINTLPIASVWCKLRPETKSAKEYQSSAASAPSSVLPGVTDSQRNHMITLVMLQG